MPSRAATIVTLLALAACGDDTTAGAGGDGGAGTAASSTASTSSTPASGSGGGGAPGEGGAGAGGDGGLGGKGGAGGEGGAPACAPSPLLDEPPQLLSETGLYASLADRTIADGVVPYAPRFELWSDGADKARWVHLPECTTIDTTDMDHWQLPAGTRLYKEFAVDGVPVETRVMHRFKDEPGGDDDWWFATYVWNEAGDEAVRTPEGVIDANGTTHDVPTELTCFGCHGYLAERALGFSAVQLAHDDAGLGLDELEAAGLLSTPAPDAAVPGDEVAVAALGSLHANCGHCHNDTGVFFLEPFHLRLLVDDATVEDTGTYETAVGVATTAFAAAPFRIAAGDAGASCVSVRMAARGNGQQMPPIGTEVVDADGLAAVEAWIAALGEGN